MSDGCEHPGRGFDLRRSGIATISNTARAARRARLRVSAALVFVMAWSMLVASTVAAWEVEGHGETPTPYGTLRWKTDRTGATAIDFDDARIADYGGLGFAVDGQYRLGDKVVLLVRVEGGSACISTHVLFTVDARHRVNVSDPFGSCGEARSHQEGEALYISTSGACSKSDSQEWLDICNEETRSEHVYRNGRLTLLYEGSLQTPRPEDSESRNSER